jgi:hypothetical protein
MSSFTDAAHHSPRWPILFLRLSLTSTAILMFGQAVLAGLFMGGLSPAFALHREMATVSGVVLIVSIVAAILAWRFGRAPRWPIAATAGLLGLMSLLAFAGFRSLVALHVPLAVIVILLTAALTMWAWKHRPTLAPQTSGSASDDDVATESPMPASEHVS